MAVILKSSDILIDETERKPNLYAANVLSGVVILIAAVCLVNEIGIFEVDKFLVRVCVLVSFTQFGVMQIIARNKKLIEHPKSKFVIMGMVLFLVLTLTVLLNIHAVLAYVLPMLLATQYRSHKVSLMALTGCCVCSLIAPVLSYMLNTWSLVFLTGYIQTFCRVTIDVTDSNAMSVYDAIWQITLYWSLPQTFTLMSFGLILYSATKSGIDSVYNQLRVVDLSNDLTVKLDSILSMQEKVLFSMSDIIESRDIETGDHVRRTSEIVRLLTDAMRDDPSSGVTDAFCENVVRSAPMHDLGKIAIPDTILRKPGKLTEEEYDTVKQHAVKSAEIISRVLTGIEDDELLETAENIAKYHHERYDGNGYPQGLKGKEIPLEARIMAIADVYDALVSERCYKASMPLDEAFKTIEDSMGSQFDPDLNRYFVSCKEKIETFYKG